MERLTLDASKAVLHRRNDSAQPWSTCGGYGYNGPTTCISDYICAYVDKWYSQCISCALPKFHKTCASSGQAEADIAGIGVLIALGMQAGFSFLFMLLAGKITPAPVSSERIVILNCLLASIDTQIITGIALIISTLSTWRSISLYHFHIVHSMISISCTFIWPGFYHVSAAMDRIYPRPAFSHRAFTGLMLLVLYVVLTSLFGYRLSKWSPNSPGNCFEGSTLFRPSEDGSSGNKVALVVMAILFVFPFLFTLCLSFGCRGHDGKKFRKNTWLLAICVCSIILLSFHAAFIRNLRRNDQHFLPPNDSENQWTFGQIVVMFSFAPIIFQLYLELRAWYLRPNNILAEEGLAQTSPRASG